MAIISHQQSERAISHSAAVEGCCRSVERQQIVPGSRSLMSETQVTFVSKEGEAFMVPASAAKVSAVVQRVVMTIDMHILSVFLTSLESSSLMATMKVKRSSL